MYKYKNENMSLEELKYKMLSKSLKDDIQLTDKQNEAFSAMVNGENIFLTGMGGVGKSATLKMFMKVYKSERNMGITSTTGISALLFNGTTLHSFTGIGLGTASAETLIKKIMVRSYLRKRWEELEVLIIDEVSMLSPELFDKLEYIARAVRRNEMPFGGIQLILSGDFCQLPVVKCPDFCFEAKSWEECVDNTIYLTEIIRQSEKDFQGCLNNVRLGKLDKKTRKLLQSRVGVKLENKHGIKPTELYSTNRNVDVINEREMDKLAETGIEFREYEMDIQIHPGVKNRQYAREKYRKNCTATDILQLCVGSQVMLLHNLEIDVGLVNGSRGVVTKFVHDIPVVKFLNGQERVIDFHVWEWEESDKKMGSVTQIPLKLAYAMTIHRSQGCSLDYVEIDLSNVFEYGQAYVALSRVKSKEGLSITDIDFDKICAHPKALEYYEKLNKRIKSCVK